MASSDSYIDLEELGIDCDNDSLTESFNKAANLLPSLVPKLDNQTLLNLYGLYKQGLQGACTTPKPSWYDIKAKSKWEAWNKLGDLPQNEAKSIYVNTIKVIDPKFESSYLKETWVTVSTLQNTDIVKDTDQSIIDHVKEGNVEKVTEMLTAGCKDEINDIDTDGLALIHWASDRGCEEMLKVLIEFGADINLKDTEGQTALHYASSCGHVDCVRVLLENGADRGVLDDEGASPEALASDDAVKELLANCL